MIRVGQLDRMQLRMECDGNIERGILALSHYKEGIRLCMTQRHETEMSRTHVCQHIHHSTLENKR